MTQKNRLLLRLKGSVVQCPTSPKREGFIFVEVRVRIILRLKSGFYDRSQVWRNSLGEEMRSRVQPAALNTETKNK